MSRAFRKNLVFLHQAQSNCFYFKGRSMTEREKERERERLKEQPMRKYNASAYPARASPNQIITQRKKNYEIK